MDRQKRLSSVMRRPSGLGEDVGAFGDYGYSRASRATFEQGADGFLHIAESLSHNFSRSSGARPGTQ